MSVMARARVLVASSIFLLFTVPSVRAELEAAMWSHMLIQIPLLFGLGMLLYPRSPQSRIHVVSGDLCGWICVAVTLMVWMIPAAMDAAVESAWVDAVKFITIVASGAWIRHLTHTCVGPLAIFFTTNLVCMIAITGLLYLDADVRLCNAYLFDDQFYTGFGLIALAICAACATILLFTRRGLRAVVSSATVDGYCAVNTQSVKRCTEIVATHAVNDER
ncbi:hypothetical protein C7H84_34960 [Burkholderia sp. Nafp2/4-1b]|uniref:hypothetical protein n=1 Tax=Burkholderia sp. Nafp2/4-1b TaxID=2116686 RepID=UPI000EF8CC2E|nr:hypothetical protein [Burkholderia sp. Nafp2/4-1b]RKT98820.1 hypothetical protein C7H84_34960 [Burkholderia sp. Nafp2/4-1b]